MHPPHVPQLTAAFLASKEQKASQKAGTGKAEELNLLLMLTFTETSVSQ